MHLLCLVDFVLGAIGVSLSPLRAGVESLWYFEKNNFLRLSRGDE